jgi:O-antigen ligase
LLVGAATFLLGVNDGSYQLTDRSAIGIAAWWAVAVAVALRLWPSARLPLAAMVAGGALAALAILTVLSTGWAVSDEKAFLEFTRVLTYLGVFAVVVLAVRARHAAAVSDGVALGIVGVVGVALASRFWWGDIGPGAPPSFFPVQTRLHYPVNYWNGLAILAGMALPLLLRAAVAQRPPILRALALAPVPAIAATIYLTSSRGGAAVAAVGVVVFCALTSRRTGAVIATAIAAAGAIGAIEVLLARDALVNGPLSAPAVAGEGESAALLIALLGALCVAVYWAWCRFADWDVRLPRGAQVAVAGAAVVVALVGVAAFDPAGKFEDFKRAPADTKYTEGDFTRSHLLSSTSTGRWQLWASAADQWETDRAFGQGAGSYQSWWTEHADFPLFVRDAHNLWLEMLGELGVAGFILIVSVFGAGFVAALTRLRRAGPARPLVAAMAGVLAAFVLGAAIDWMWELTIVALVAVVALGMLVGAATLPDDGAPPRRRPFGARGEVPARALRAGAVALALAAAMCVTVPMLAQERLEESQAAAEAGQVAKALDSADDARSLEPWASSPYVQMALIEERAGNLRRANRHIRGALERDSREWSTWLVAARIQTKAGLVRQGRRSLRRAKALNPTSQLFEDLRNETRDRASG